MAEQRGPRRLMISSVSMLADHFRFHRELELVTTSPLISLDVFASSFLDMTFQQEGALVVHRNFSVKNPHAAAWVIRDASNCAQILQCHLMFDLGVRRSSLQWLIAGVRRQGRRPRRHRPLEAATAEPGRG